MMGFGEGLDKLMHDMPTIGQELDKATADPDAYMAAVLLQRTTGLDVNSEHGSETPKRFVKMLREMTTRDPEFKFTTFDNTENVDEMVVQTGIPFFTFCNHHIVPFYGTAHVAYIPNKSVVGLSKLARTVVHLSKGLWVQEHLTVDIADYLESRLAPLGVGVVIEAEHMCMTMRGAKIPGTVTTTAAMRGVFADHGRTAKAEFLAHIERHSK